MSSTRYQDLRIYRLAEELSDVVWKIVGRWPNFARRTMGEQLVRCVDSIGANTAEGAGRGTFRDNKRFAMIARGSLYETQYWLRRAYKRGLLQTEETTQLKNMIDNLIPQFNAYINSLKNRS